MICCFDSPNSFAAAAAAKLFGLSKAQIVAAFGVAGSQAAGSLQFLVNGAWNKRYQVGAAAMNGVIAATLARSDFVGATESVEGKHGLLVGYSDNAHPDKAIAGLGEVALALNGAQYGALRALEVNPLWVNGDQVEALDVLVVTGPERAEGPPAATGLRSDGGATREGAAWKAARRRARDKE